MTDWIKAVDSAWRAFLKQYRRMRSLQRNASTVPTPF